ncbi:hypothetical protein DOO78_26725 [Roseicella frigidaeris]|uniref:Uncharacterized protein n=2 Tax=Roseomonadaceae TaxID=3385906 RepID=A0A327LTH9_9PROT|nr:hypothetical protein DOO78_26725 [Roseicella frigidaeris]
MQVHDDDIEQFRRTGLRLVEEIRAAWTEAGLFLNDLIRKRQLADCLDGLNARTSAWGETPEREERARAAVIEIANAALRYHPALA